MSFYKKIILFFWGFFALSETILAQEYVVEWDHGNGGSSIDNAYALEKISGGFLLAGYTRSTNGDITTPLGGRDGFVVYTDFDGNIIWKKNYGGSEDEEIHKAIELSDGNFLFAGYTRSTEGELSDNHGAKDCWLLKTNADGDVLWQNTYGGSHTDIAYDLEELSDGSIVVGASSSSGDHDLTLSLGNGGYWIFKVNASGALQWQTKMGTHLIQRVGNMAATADGGFMLSGSSQDHSSGDHMTVGYGGYDFWTIKLDANGNFVWDKTIGGTENDFLRDIHPTSDGGYILFGQSSSTDNDFTTNAGGADWWLVKMTASNTIDWKKRYGGSENEAALRMSIAPDGGYIMTGYTWSQDGDIVDKSTSGVDVWVLRVSSSGAILWSRTFGSNFEDLGYDVLELDEDNFVVAATVGGTSEDISSHSGTRSMWIGKFTKCASYTGDETASICEGTSYDFGSQTLTTSGLYTETFSSVIGCDSTVNLTLDVLPSTHEDCNNAPEAVGSIPDQNLIQGFTAYSIDLRPYFQDLETSDADMVFLYSGASLVTISIMNSFALITDKGLIGTETISFIARDEGGKMVTQSCKFTISAASDTQPPVIDCLPTQNEYCLTHLPDYASTITVTDNIDPDPLIFQSPSPGTTFTSGQLVTITAKDDAGNTSNCSFTVVLDEDVTPPVVECPADILLSCDDPIMPNVLPSLVLSDDCGAIQMVTQSVPAGTTITGITEVTIIVTDVSDNIASCSFMVSLTEDTTPPTFDCPAPVVVNCSANTIPNLLGSLNTNDDCSGVASVTQSIPEGTLITGSTDVIISVTDEAGNMASCTVNVSLTEDTTPPTFDCPAPVVVNCSANTIPNLLGSLNTSDDCSGVASVTQSIPEGTIITGSTAVVITVTDVAGNSASCTVNFSLTEDTTPPTFDCPAPVVVNCSANTIPNLLGSLNANDDCSGVASVTQSIPEGTLITGSTAVVISVTDEAGNTASCTVKVSLTEDTTPPTFDCPASVVLDCAVNSIPNLLGSLNANDDCSGVASVSQSIPEGTIITGSTDVVITVTDETGNATSCTVNVSLTVDTTPPTFDCPLPVVLECGSNYMPNLLLALNAADNCSTILDKTQSIAMGVLVKKDTDVFITVTDQAGNSTNCTVAITIINDTTPPTFYCPPPVTLNCNETSMPDLTAKVLVPVDACSGIASITQSIPEGSPVSSGTTNVEVYVTDGAGNTASCTVPVTVPVDETPPSFACPAPITLACGVKTMPSIIDFLYESDYCSGIASVTQSVMEGTALSGETDVVITVTDGAGNSATCSVMVSVTEDITPPTFDCPAPVTLGCGVTLMPDLTTSLNAMDDCTDIAFIAQSVPIGTEISGTTEVEISVRDGAGNTATCTVSVALSTDSTGPVLVCPESFSFSCGEILPDVTDQLNATDDCSGIQSITQSIEPGTVINKNTTIEFTATDNKGNVTSCSVPVEVQSVELIQVEEEITVEMGQSITIETSTAMDGEFVWTPPLYLNNAYIQNPVVQPSNSISYTVYFTADNGCKDEKEVSIAVETPDTSTKLGFSPNNDGIRDTWIVNGLETDPDNEVYLFNRWGDLVYQENGYNNTSKVFDGTANRNTNIGAGTLPEGTYFYKIKTSVKSIGIPLSGYLVLKR